MTPVLSKSICQILLRLNTEEIFDGLTVDQVSMSIFLDLFSSSLTVEQLTVVKFLVLFRPLGFTDLIRVTRSFIKNSPFLNVA
jgi:hypothetical protein